MPIVTTAVTGALAAAITNYFQKRQFKFREKETRQSELRGQREEFVNGFMSRVSERLFDLIGVIQIITGEISDPEEIEMRVESYEEAVKKTAICYSVDLAYLNAFFGADISRMYSQQIMEGPAGLVEIGRAWRIIFNKYMQAKFETLPNIDKWLVEGKISEEKAIEATASLQEFIDLLVEEAKNIRQKARDLGYNPIGSPFYSILTSKEYLLETPG